MDELEALVTLTQIPLLGAIKIRLLLNHFGTAQKVLEADLATIADIPGFGERIMESWKESVASRGAVREIELAEKEKISIVPFNDRRYPKKLLEIADFPILLYMKGDWKPCDSQSIAVVGTRNMSIYGGEVAAKISADLAAAGVTVVSGLARGIDTAAHAGALKRGRTVAVIGSGLCDIYPRENSALAQKITENGVLMSEFPLRTPPDRQNFPQRNRIVSGMSMGTLLVEAPEKSGAMITMDRALSQGRKLFAIPGRIDSDNFTGNHKLIKCGEAQLVESAKDILESFGDLFCYRPDGSRRAESAKILLEKDEELFLGKLPKHEFSFDEIVQLTALPVAKVNFFVMSLIIKKALKEYPGKMFKKVF